MSAERTIVFADVSGSTRINELMGDVEGRAFIGGVVDDLARLVAHLNGTVVKTIGDEIMCTFDSPMDGVVGAIELQRLARRSPAVEGHQPRIRVGLNWGAVVEEGGDVFGDAVNVAARVAAMSKADQILTTGDTISALGAAAIPSRPLGEHDFKGKAESIPIFEILWEENPDELTAIANQHVKRPVDLRCLLQVQGRDYEIDGDASVDLQLGRTETSDVPVPDSAVSRSHADIAVRGGRFYLADHSTNGTFVRQKGHDAIFVHQDEILLQGSGEIRLGRNFDDTEGPVLQYRVVVD